MVRNGVIATWYDCMISPGTEWKKEIAEHLESSQIILLLVSPDFVASNFCSEIEMKRAMECHDKNEARVIPVILRPADWEGEDFSKLHALPEGRRPIALWANEDEAFVSVVRGIRVAVEGIRVAVEERKKASKVPIEPSHRPFRPETR